MRQIAKPDNAYFQSKLPLVSTASACWKAELQTSVRGQVWIRCIMVTWSSMAATSRRTLCGTHYDFGPPSVVHRWNHA